MRDMTDRRHLLSDQYENSSNLRARAELHTRFSTNTYGWPAWVFDQLDLPLDCRILELGCGAGLLWLDNMIRVPEPWSITLSDLSAGMVQEAQNNLRGRRQDLGFVVADAESIPLDDASVEAVIANHMLYHVPDRRKAFSEIRRVLKPGGCLLAATNGRQHMRELEQLVQRVDPSTIWDAQAAEFGLENGGEQLSRWFSRVTLDRYEDSLVVTEAKPLVAYVLSTGRPDLHGEELARVIQHEIDSSGAFKISKDAGLFKAWKTRAVGVRHA